MRRKVFDKLVSAGGAVVVVVLLVAGGLAMWGYTFANSEVTSELSAQKITFPTAAELAHPQPFSTTKFAEITPGMVPYLKPYAGQELTTGSGAYTYANHFIAIHLQEIGAGQTYAQLSSKALALPRGSAAYTALESEVQKVFQGTTLRGLLLEAYGFSVFGQIALVGSIVCFALALVMALLVGLGLWHSRRAREDEEILASKSSTLRAA